MKSAYEYNMQSSLYVLCANGWLSKNSKNLKKGGTGARTQCMQSAFISLCLGASQELMQNFVMYKKRFFCAKRDGNGMFSALQFCTQLLFFCVWIFLYVFAYEIEIIWLHKYSIFILFLHNAVRTIHSFQIGG